MARQIGAYIPKLAPVFRSILLGLMMAAPLAGAQAQEPAGLAEEILDRPFPYQAKEVGIEAMLQDVTAKTGVPVILSDKIGGSVTLDNPEGRLRDALAELTGQGKALWWFDGSALHVEPPANMVSRLIGLDGFGVEALRRQLDAVGLANAQYPLRAESDAEMVRVVAPRGYAEAVAELAAHMAAARKSDEPKKTRGLPNVIRGRGWH
ncbi:hypothetical protein [Paracoccus aminophilus]|uniref:Type III secretion outer membrane pore n=1 Tax=Paracoccus aminophilus JCM 7686 TaxID=1367847 RepID=S5YUG7_PARAH|nr:hypothetical protein [Paracoccus aminophilus]AGT08886.1 type III secretion outer membrane pore [Paracoccus aminophilus JCM 7686]